MTLGAAWLAFPNAAAWLILYVLAERLVELPYANRNTKRLLREGGVEHGAGHYPLFILLHGSWLIAMILLAPARDTLNPWLLAAFVATQALRFWTLASIGRWWTTRIISAPHFPRVRRGPYRFLSHPNYVVVVCEIALVPLLLGLPWVALAFSALNAALLTYRIRYENRVLVERG